MYLFYTYVLPVITG